MTKLEFAIHCLSQFPRFVISSFLPLFFVAGGLPAVVKGTDNYDYAFYKGSLWTSLGNTDPENVAKAVRDFIPTIADIKAISFEVIHNESGRRIVKGLLYGTRDYGFFKISNLDGKIATVKLDRNIFTLVK